MKNYEEEFKGLLRDISAGSQEAARTFLTEYGGYIIAAVRRRLHQKLRSKFDSQDFLQDVCVSFFRSPPPPEAFADSKALLNYLAKLARDKVFATYRARAVSERHNVNRENSLDGSARARAHLMPSTDPTPSQTASAKEELEREGLPFRMTIRMLRLGYTYKDIAASLNVTVRQVKRYVQILRKRCQE